MQVSLSSIKYSGRYSYSNKKRIHNTSEYAQPSFKAQNPYDIPRNYDDVRKDLKIWHNAQKQINENSDKPNAKELNINDAWRRLLSDTYDRHSVMAIMDLLFISGIKDPELTDIIFDSSDKAISDAYYLLSKKLINEPLHKDLWDNNGHLLINKNGNENDRYILNPYYNSKTPHFFENEQCIGFYIYPDGTDYWNFCDPKTCSLKETAVAKNFYNKDLGYSYHCDKTNLLTELKILTEFLAKNYNNPHSSYTNIANKIVEAANKDSLNPRIDINALVDAIGDNGLRMIHQITGFYSIDAAIEHARRPRMYYDATNEVGRRIKWLSEDVPVIVRTIVKQIPNYDTYGKFATIIKKLR